MPTSYQQAKQYGPNRNAGTGIPSRALMPGLIQYAEKDVTSAQVLALNATPVEIIPAPGAGLVLEFISAICILDHGGTDYVTARTLNFQYGGGGTTVSDAVAGAAFINQADDAVVVCQALSAEVELTPNAGIEVTLAGGEVTAGNSPLYFKVAYRVHATGL